MNWKNVRAHGLRRSIAILVVTGCLAACGGGDEEDQSSASRQEPPPAAPPNSTPTIAGNPPSQVLVGESLDFTPTAFDADGDVLTFSVQRLPSWASFDPRTGRISGTPKEQDAGSYTGIRISVTDGAADASLPPFTITVVFAAQGVATLTWTAPSQRKDGSPVELAGYKVYWGTASRKYSHSTQIGANVASYVVENLTPATWYFAVTALDRNGLESDYSNEATKVVQ